MANRRNESTVISENGAPPSVYTSRLKLNDTMARRRRRAARALLELGLCLSAALMLASLFALNIAANAHLWEPQPQRRQKLSYDLLSELGTGSSTNGPQAQFALADKSLPNNLVDDDAKVRQFLRQLMLSRKLLDERLAHEEAERHPYGLSAGFGAEERPLAIAPTIELPSSSVDYDSFAGGRPEAESKAFRQPASELALANSASDSSRAMPTGEVDDESQMAEVQVTNPNYRYSVSPVDDGAQAEFLGQFGAPLTRRQQSKRDDEEKAEHQLKHPGTQKLTTLLEDEEDEKSTGKLSSDDESRISFGRVLHEARPAGSGAEQPEPGFLRRMFSRVYDQLASYVPNFWTDNATKIAEDKAPTRNSGALGQDGTQTTGKLRGEAGRPEVGSVTSPVGLDADAANDQSSHAKQGVSVAGEVGEGARANNKSEQTSSASKTDEPPSYSLRPSLTMSDKDKKDSTDNGQTLALSHSSEPMSGSALKRVHLEESNMLDMSQFWPLQQLQRDQAKMEPVRVQDSNSMVSPFNQATGLPGSPNRQQESLLGKYVYAPTQHYYLGGSPLPQHFNPGDRLYGSAQQQLEPAYAYRKQDDGFYGPPLTLTSSSQEPAGPQGSNNDLYFLLMVGSFCGVAIAMMLATGLFAYRAQQQRKSSQADAEYPTYGVVGPNNMSGKSGAAAFVGGYFAGNHGGAGSATFANHLANSGKSGSAKHLPDLYASALNSGSIGTAGSDSGLASLDTKLCSTMAMASGKKSGTHERAGVQSHQQHMGQDAARMYHYQHQKQQMIVSDRSSAGRHTSASDLDSDDENEDGSYTVYECPGLASAHEMEIKNPLFNDERTP